jgi:hypothetical protein
MPVGFTTSARRIDEHWWLWVPAQGRDDGVVIARTHRIDETYKSESLGQRSRPLAELDDLGYLAE